MTDYDLSKFAVCEQDIVIGEGPNQVLAARMVLLVNPFIIDEATADTLVNDFNYKLANTIKDQFNEMEKTKV